MIHYHGTPCGATREDVARFLSGRHALIPWPRPEDIGTAAEVCQSFCLDNGAYTIWKSRKPDEVQIGFRPDADAAAWGTQDWSEYFRWTAEWLQHPACDFAIIPDVIDGTEADNDLLIGRWHAKMRGRLQFKGAPVWHMHESLSRLKHLCEHHERVCLGSSGEWPVPGRKKWWRRMAEAMAVCCDESGRPLTKLHGLRMLDPEVFSLLPLSSADSTNAVRNSSSYKRFGMYCPPNASTRMSIIAERIEKHQSVAIWVPPTWLAEEERQGELDLKDDEEAA